MKPSPEYLAGLFDGEGCLYVFGARDKRRNGVHFMQARVCLSNTHLPTLELIRAEWKGQISFVGTKPGRLQNYRLDWSGHDELLSFLRAIQPFLLIKKAQVDLFLAEFAPTMRAGMRKHTPLTAEQHAKRAEVMSKLQVLKRVEYPAA